VYNLQDSAQGSKISSDDVTVSVHTEAIHDRTKNSEHLEGRYITSNDIIYIAIM